MGIYCNYAERRHAKCRILKSGTQNVVKMSAVASIFDTFSIEQKNVD